MLRLLTMISLVGVVLLASCTGNATPTPSAIDPLALVTEAAANIRAAETFRISVTQMGPDYALGTEYGTAYFRSATAQFVAPREMQANVRVVAAGLPIQIDVFSRAEDQWYRAIWTGNQWLNQPFQAGFNPETLVSEESGFQSALDSLIELNYVGEAELESGAQVYHLTATANGPDVSALLGGLIEPVGEVLVDAYIDRESRQPVRFVIQEFNSPFAATPEAGEEAEPVVWTIDIYDFNAPAELDEPQIDESASADATDDANEGFVGVPSLDTTAEATSEATPES